MFATNIFVIATWSAKLASNLSSYNYLNCLHQHS